MHVDTSGTFVGTSGANVAVDTALKQNNMGDITHAPYPPASSFGTPAWAECAYYYLLQKP